MMISDINVDYNFLRVGQVHMLHVHVYTHFQVAFQDGKASLQNYHTNILEPWTQNGAEVKRRPPWI